MPASYLIGCVFSVFFLHAIYEQLPIPKALIVSLSTGIYLGLFGMTIANITQSALAGYSAGLIYWLFEAGFDGRLTAPFYLFIVSNQVNNPASEIWGSPFIWLPHQIGLVVSIPLDFFHQWLAS